MSKLFRFVSIITGFLVFSTAVWAQQNQIKESKPLGSEKSMVVDIECGYGNLNISPGDRDKAFDVDITYDKEVGKPQFDYEVKDHVGYLEVNMEDGNDVHIKDDHAKGQWNIGLNPILPTTLNVELGLGNGNMEFGGLKLTEVKLSNGLSETELNISKPNSQTIEEMKMETGLGEFRGKNLANARFKHMKFDCGLGKTTLDFHGEGLDQSYVDVSVGLGSATLIFPEDVGVRVEKESSFLSHVSLDSDFKAVDDYYYTSNWNDAKKRVKLTLEVGLGSASVERIK